MAKWTRAYIDSLPDSAFLIILPGGEKEDGFTEPRSKRKFPVRDNNGNVDKAHLDNALARIPQSNISEELKAKAQRRAEKLLEQFKGEGHGNMKKSLGKMSYNDLRSELQAIVQQKYGQKSKDGNYWVDYPWVEDVYENEVVVQKDGRYYIADYSVNADGKVTIGPFYNARKLYNKDGKQPVHRMGKPKPSNEVAVEASSR
ncbi:hypothetical protein SD70_02445 [Gordoniibacillus kamchatkensis]|uniref:Uncharacterized protein n=1 Tax=Gordoniibacillus kamchatkensis TaxID=1590651 RepID=A0ABR5AML5_9BACL|nr:hypothetical protein [Paenibacillus sp. VKM B-2647]KIL42063.1 hypothetical protein SD70_02445 [Paenibacillus sp. VKM B-2647]